MDILKSQEVVVPKFEIHQDNPSGMVSNKKGIGSIGFCAVYCHHNDSDTSAI